MDNFVGGLHSQVVAGAKTGLAVIHVESNH
jgi:hypothetical protein